MKSHSNPPEQANGSWVLDGLKGIGNAFIGTAEVAWHFAKKPTAWGLGIVATLEATTAEVMGNAYDRDTEPAQYDEVRDQMLASTPLVWGFSRLIGWTSRRVFKSSAETARKAMLIGGPVLGMAGGRTVAYAVEHGEINMGALTGVDVGEVNTQLPTAVVAAGAALIGSKSAQSQPLPVRR